MQSGKLVVQRVNTVGVMILHLGPSRSVPFPSWLPYSFPRTLASTYLIIEPDFWYHKMCPLLLYSF